MMIVMLFTLTSTSLKLHTVIYLTSLEIATALSFTGLYD